MLQAIREHAQGWFAWVIVVLISVPFALWGIQEYTKVGGQPPVATVDGHQISDRELSQQVQQARATLRARMGHYYKPELVDQAKLRKDVLNELINNQLTADASLTIGLRVGDEQVRASIIGIPSFQKDGQFDESAYERALNMRGIPPAQFEEQMRTSLMTEQLNRIISFSEFATEQDLAEMVQLRLQQRGFKYFLLPIKDFIAKSAIPDQELSDYYKTHQELFRIPEQVKLDYVVLKQNDSTYHEEITEANLQALYQVNIKQYQTPEQRQIRHILVALGPKATPKEEQAARKRIAEIRTRIVNGADFATVAKKESADPGSAMQGGDLGLVGRGVMDQEFERSAFALPKGVLSEPVRSAFGLHLIEVTNIQPEHTKPFVEVREELAASARADGLSKHYLSTAERLGNLAYEHPDSLEPAAQALGLKIQHSDWLAKTTGGAGILSNPKVLTAAFSDEVLTQSNNSDVLEVTIGHEPQAIVLRVAEHRDAFIKPLTEVKAQIIESLRQDQAQQSARKQAEALAERLRKGGALSKVAASYKVIEQAPAQRDKIQNLPKEILDSVFKLPQSRPTALSVDVVPTQGVAIAVVVLGEVRDGKLADLDKDKRKDESRNLAQSQAKSHYDEMLDDLKQQAKIWIAPHQDERTIDTE